MAAHVAGLNMPRFVSWYGIGLRMWRLGGLAATAKRRRRAEKFGAERGTLPGGRYACVRLQGEPPGVYAEIGPTAERLAQRADADEARPTLEYYRRRDLIDVLVPIL